MSVFCFINLYIVQRRVRAGVRGQSGTPRHNVICHLMRRVEISISEARGFNVVLMCQVLLQSVATSQSRRRRVWRVVAVYADGDDMHPNHQARRGRGQRNKREGGGPCPAFCFLRTSKHKKCHDAHMMLACCWFSPLLSLRFRCGLSLSLSLSFSLLSRIRCALHFLPVDSLTAK